MNDHFTYHAPGPIRLVGIVSDTHNLLRPQVLERLAGVDLIVHAGDIMRPEILEELRRIAPLVAVRGNNDRSLPTGRLAETASFPIGSMRGIVIHELPSLRIDPEAEGYSLVVSGHTHRPSLRRERNVWYLNPGSVGPRRFRLGVTMAFVRQIDGRLVAEIADLPGHSDR